MGPISSGSRVEGSALGSGTTMHLSGGFGGGLETTREVGWGGDGGGGRMGNVKGGILRKMAVL